MNVIAEKLLRSWELFKRSVLVIREHPKLLAFPIVTGFLTTAIALFFLAPVGLVLLAPDLVAGSSVQALANSIGLVQQQDGGSFDFQVQPLGAAILAGVYLLNMFVATMASVAFSHQILGALSGQPVSITRGITAACDRWKSILVWSLLAGVVGLIIRTLEEKLAFVGRLVAGLIGLTWSVASIFAIPILVREPSVLNPFAILSKSAEANKQTWGETLAGYAGLQGTNILVLWASLLSWGVVGVTAHLFSNAWILLLFGVPWLLALIAYGYLASVASRVYLCALYLYASEGSVPKHFDASMMDKGWKWKKTAR